MNVYALHVETKYFYKHQKYISSPHKPACDSSTQYRGFDPEIPASWARRSDGNNKPREMVTHPSIGTILWTEHRCCWSRLLGYWAQSWMSHHSDAGYSNGLIIPTSWYSFCRPQKDDRPSQLHLLLIQQLSRIITQDPRIPSPSPKPLSQHQA